MKFDQVIGHKELKEKLSAGVDSSRIAHAQLFAGSLSSGSLAMALSYAQYINCSHKHGGDSCGECPSCVKMQELMHPDVHFVLPSSTPKVLSENYMKQFRELVKNSGGYFTEQQWYGQIEMEGKQGLISKAEADEIIKKLSFKSFEGGYKIVVILLAERMRTEAANALLKILEEPWEKTVFLLVCEDQNVLLPTILSRTQLVEIPSVDSTSIGEYLISQCGVEPSSAESYASLCGGSVIKARGLVNGEANDDDLFDDFVSLMRLSYNDKHMELLEWADMMAGIGRERQKMFFSSSVKLLRDSYMINAGLSSIVNLWGKQRDFCDKFAPFIGNHNIEQLVAEMELASLQISRNGNAKMIFSHFALSVSKKIIRL